MGTIPKDGSKRVLKRSKELRLSAQPGKVDTALEISEIFATTAKHVADVAGVPGLGQAAEIVLSILNRVQDMRDNKGEFQQLAQEAQELVASIRDAFALALDNATQAQADTVKKQIQELNKDIQKLVRVLAQINEFAGVKAKRNWFWRFIYTRYDLQTIRQFRDAMQHAHTDFNVRTNVVLRVDMAQVHFKTDQILEAMKRLEQQQGSGTPFPAAPQISYNRSADSGFGSGSELRERWLQNRPRPPSATLVHNYSGQGATVYSTVDNSVHDNSRVHYGDVVNTNTYNSSPTQYSHNSVNRQTQPNYNRRGYGYQHQGNQWVDDRY